MGKFCFYFLVKLQYFNYPNQFWNKNLRKNKNKIFSKTKNKNSTNFVYEFKSVSFILFILWKTSILFLLLFVFYYWFLHFLLFLALDANTTLFTYFCHFNFDWRYWDFLYSLTDDALHLFYELCFFLLIFVLFFYFSLCACAPTGVTIDFIANYLR